MKSNKLLMLAVLVLLVGCLTPMVSAKTKTDSIKAVGKGTVANLDTGAEYKAANGVSSKT